jgi:ParB family chromosome partitioning protein
MTETKRLGRGLEALLGPISKDDARGGGGLREISVTAIAPNPYQPRREFEEAPLQELARGAAPGLAENPRGDQGSG